MQLRIIGACVLLSACVAGRTTIQSSWADNGYSGAPLDRIAVVALFETRAESLAFEENAAAYFSMHGVAAVPGHTVLTPEQTRTLDEAEVRNRFAATDVDGVLIFRLLAVDERREYLSPAPYLPNVPPDVLGANPSAWYYEPSWNYYWFLRSSADVAAEPGYWLEQVFVVAETALFDNRDGRLLWTAKSETMDDAHFERTSTSLVRAVARRLFAQDLIATATGTAAPAPHGRRG